VSPLQAFASCFPGGSITGAPKIEAMQVIAEHEPYARGVYCGSIGYISNHGRIDMNIAIRTITATKNTLYLAAGGAIVIDSDCDEEYAECFTKMAGIFKGLY
jgi:para-aminobenzoate synthetase component 1